MHHLQTIPHHIQTEVNLQKVELNVFNGSYTCKLFETQP